MLLHYICQCHIVSLNLTLMDNLKKIYFSSISEIGFKDNYQLYLENNIYLYLRKLYRRVLSVNPGIVVLCRRTDGVEP